MKRAFADRPGDERMAIRQAAENLGGYIQGYNGEGVTVAMPNDPRACAAIEAAMAEAGLPFVMDRHYFPLGTDKPRDELRHSVYPYDERGFWLFQTFAPEVS